MTCWRTRSRRAVSAAAVEVGLASIDWQMPNAPQAKRALPLSLPIAHRRLMSGTLTTNTRAPGSPDLSRLSAASICARKVATEVIVDSLDVQASLPPMSMVTYPTRWPTAVAACPAMSVALAPDLASLLLWPEIAELLARMRR